MCAVSILGSLVYAMFGSGVEQPWSRDSGDGDELKEIEEVKHLPTWQKKESFELKN